MAGELLYVHAQLGDMTVVTDVVRESPSEIDWRALDRSTPIFIASEHGRTNIVKILLTAGADMNASKIVSALKIRGRLLSSPSPSALGTAAFALIAGEWRLLAQLRELRIPNILNGLQDGATPLFIAAEKGYGEVVRLLLDAGASLKVRTVSDID